MKSSSLTRLALGLALALLVAAPVAIAADGELDRGEYVERLEPICKRNSQANARILKGVEGQVRKGKLAPAGKRFIRASNALARSIRQMAAVPKPAADTAKLNKWFRYLLKEKAYLRLIGKALKARQKGRVNGLARRLRNNNNAANNTVITYGFRECRIEESRFV